MNRRNLLKEIRDISLLSPFFPFIDIAVSNAKSAGKVVILGAGWGGLSAAKTIKIISPEVEVIIIDSNKQSITNHPQRSHTCSLFFEPFFFLSLALCHHSEAESF